MMRLLFRRLFRALVRAAGREESIDGIGKSVVVFAPHQDDETLGCGGTIIRLRKANVAVHIAFLTDGSQSHAKFMPADKLVLLRRDEAIAASESLGVAADNVVFFNLKDGQLSNLEPEGVQLASQLLERVRPEAVFVPYFLDGPPDHEASTRIVYDAVRQSKVNATLFEYPVWFWFHWPWSRMDSRGLEAIRELRTSLGVLRRLRRDFRFCMPINEELAQKRDALAKHKSQVERLIPDPAWSVLADVSSGDWLECLMQDHEIFYRHCLVDGR